MHTLLVDALEHLGYEVGAHAAERTLHATLGENLVVTDSLQDGHVVLLLVVANLAAHSHALRQDVHELVVELVNLPYRDRSEPLQSVRRNPYPWTADRAELLTHDVHRYGRDRR